MALGKEFDSVPYCITNPGSVLNCLWGPLGSNVRVGYYIPVPHFYFVLQYMAFNTEKSAQMD